MAKGDVKDLTRFLKPFSKEVNDLVFWLRAFVWDLYPRSNELIYDNYNALAFGWSPSDKAGDTFCSIAVGRTTKNVHFGFYWGSKISDPKKMLIGNGNQYRYLLVHDKESFPASYLKARIKEAFLFSESKMKKTPGLPSGATILKSISGKKRTKKSAAKKVAPKKRVVIKKK